ncbi:MAG: HipA family kinase [Prevotella sp.]
MQTVSSIKRVEHKYMTGEEPLLVTCSDLNAYICKYMRSSASAYKMVCELVGQHFADIWSLNAPKAALVMIKPSHWPNMGCSHSVSAPCIGSRKIDGALDVTSSTIDCMVREKQTLHDLLRIALFDFWIANEDRNSNNYNLLYDVNGQRIAAIDFGCIFNTATFDYPLSQLTATDTVLYSELFEMLSRETNEGEMTALCRSLHRLYHGNLLRCRQEVEKLLSLLPKEWHVPQEVVDAKVMQLFEASRTEAVWNNFMECLNENYCNGEIKI